MVKGLVLYPLQPNESPASAFGPCNEANTLLPDFRIFQQLIDLSGQTTPNGEEIKEKPTLTTYWMPGVFQPTLAGVGECKTDGNGQKLTFVRVREFKRLVVPEGTESENKAIIAHIASLPEKTAIILFWT